VKLERAQATLAAQKLLPAVEQVESETSVQNDAVPTGDQAPAIHAKTEKQKPAQTTQLSKEQILKAIQGIEDALEQGTVLVAQNFDRELRGVDARVAGLSTEQKERLLRVRAELAHLQGWAKWGGNISRDELIKAAEELPQKELPVAELASKVKGLRERWKSLEASSGSAPKEVWERFDLACTNAYAPAAAHFAQLALERQENLEKAEALIAEFSAKVPQLLTETPDWKAIIRALQEFKQARQKIGHVERKHMARIAQDFDAAYAKLSEPLRARQDEALKERQALVQEAVALTADQRNAVEHVRALQARWQTQAQTLPLRRNDEQALWEKFREACDALFAQRRSASEVLDAQRKENLAAKEEICAKLERAEVQTESATNQLLQETAAEWRAIGFVDREVEASIEQRYQSAVRQVKDAAQKVRAAQEQQAKEVIEQKLHLIAKVDTELLQANAAAAQVLLEEWNELVDTTSKSFAKIHASLNARFERALAALQTEDTSYVKRAVDHAASFDEQLLQLEVRHGIDSPAELSQERLQAQVAVLRSSLTSGSGSAGDEQLRELLSLPLVWDEVQRSRVFKLVRSVL
jgi:DNA repair protein SbcC/Rad50